MKCPECNTVMIIKEHNIQDYSGKYKVKSPTCPNCGVIMRWDKYGEVI